MGWKLWIVCAVLFAIFGVFAGLLGIGTITQVNGITSAVQSFFDPNNTHVAFTIGGISYSWAVVIGGLFVTVCVALVVIGGIKRIAKVSGIIVPFMAIIYVVLALIILIMNVTRIPDAFVLIFRCAFTPVSCMLPTTSMPSRWACSP